MNRRFALLWGAIFLALWLVPEAVSAPREERWTNGTPYGVFFNNYDPNFYTGFVPRVQERERIKIHLGRGNQIRVRMILSDRTVENYLPDQVARYDQYKEVIDKKIITLTSNMAWEAYHERVMKEGLHDLAKKKDSLGSQEWRKLNLAYMARLSPGRLFHIRKDFKKMAEDFAGSLRNASKPEKLRDKLDVINGFFRNRLFLHDLTEEQDQAFGALIALAQSGDLAAFYPKAEAFFHAITEGIYPIKDGVLDYYEFTTIYPAGTYDKTTTYKGKVIPAYTTTGVWWLIPRMHGRGFLGMVDYISSAGYYGMMPMLPYQYGGSKSYNAIHNPGISCWIQGHRLLPKEWRHYKEGSRSGKPYFRASITSRGPVSHGCTRLNPGHLTEFREMLPSTSKGMEGIMHFRSLSHCYDVFDIKGDGNDQVMGVQYYIAFRHTRSRVAKEIWAQNIRKDFYAWLYGDEIHYGPIGKVTFKEAYGYTFLKRKALQGRKYNGIGLYEAPYEKEYLQFYMINGVKKLSKKGMDFNREMRRVGYGYQVDRKVLLLDR
ncbi:MAG: hypothetical protein GY849_00850 [Deltaproteobacteria bacterium]|nr:hypothetical protein [Deltaproteobacteria bacterium]